MSLSEKISPAERALQGQLDELREQLVPLRSEQSLLFTQVSSISADNKAEYDAKTKQNRESIQSIQKQIAALEEDMMDLRDMEADSGEKPLREQLGLVAMKIEAFVAHEAQGQAHLSELEAQHTELSASTNPDEVKKAEELLKEITSTKASLAKVNANIASMRSAESGLKAKLTELIASTAK